LMPVHLGLAVLASRLLLNRRTRNVAIGAKDATAARLRFHEIAAAFAAIEIVPGVGAHRLGACMPAPRTRNCR
jgi:hypothetical protein